MSLKLFHRTTAALFCAATLVHAADTIRVERDGQFWRVDVSGNLPSRGITRISAEGDLTLRGKPSATVRYTISARVNATTEAQARLFAKGLATVRIANEALLFKGPGAVSVEFPRNTPILVLTSDEGGIDAADLDGSVHAKTVAGRIMLDRIARDVEIRSNGGPTALGTIGGSVHCYSGGGGIRAIRIQGEAFFETSGGDIQVGEVKGTLRAMTGGGTIHIDKAGSRVFAGTGGGPVAILQAMGFVTAQSAAGPIDIGSAPAVECMSGGGTIRLNSVSGKMNASTDRGSVIAVVVSGRHLEDSYLSTASGDILVILPSDMGVTVDAEMVGSRMRNSIVSDYPDLKPVAGRSSVTARGAINGGGAKLRLRAAGGRIQIQKK